MSAGFYLFFQRHPKDAEHFFYRVEGKDLAERLVEVLRRRDDAEFVLKQRHDGPSTGDNNDRFAVYPPNLLSRAEWDTLDVDLERLSTQAADENFAPKNKLRQLRIQLYRWARDAERTMVEGDRPADAATTAPTSPQSPSARRAKWLANAMLLVRDHPDWSDAEIARQTDISPGTLSRCREYKTAAKLARGSKSDRHEGYIKTGDESGGNDVEAVAPPDAPEDGPEDRGKPIPNSQYYREYCRDCGQEMRVRQDQVGTKPLCDRCKQ